MSIIDKIILFVFGKEWYINKLRKMGVKIGNNTYMYGVIVDSLYPNLINIGDNCTITRGVVLLAHDASPKVKGLDMKVDPVNIGNNVFIGINSVILPGVTIGNNSIIGAGSIVTKSFDGNCVIAGNPAKVIGEI